MDITTTIDWIKSQKSTSKYRKTSSSALPNPHYTSNPSSLLKTYNLNNYLHHHLELDLADLQPYPHSMENNIVNEVRDAAMEIVIDTRLQARLFNGRTEKEATDDLIIHLSTLDEDDFQKGIAILRQRDLIADSMDVYFEGWQSVVIGPSGPGQGVTVLNGQEMDLLPFGAQRLIPDPNLDSHGQLTVNFDFDIAQPDISWINRGGLSYGAPQLSISEAINSLPRQTVSKTVFLGEKADCALCRNELENDATVIVLPCGHWFCYACTMSWLSDNDSCPLCRHKVFGNM